MNCEDLSWITGDVQTFANSGEADLALFSDIAILEPMYALKTEGKCVKPFELFRMKTFPS